MGTLDSLLSMQAIVRYSIQQLESVWKKEQILWEVVMEVSVVVVSNHVTNLCTQYPTQLPFGQVSHSIFLLAIVTAALTYVMSIICRFNYSNGKFTKTLAGKTEL